MKPHKTTLKEIQEAYGETYKTMKWVWQEILSPTGRRQTIRSTIALSLAMLVGMSVTYVAKEAINAVGAGERTLALWYTLFGIGGLHIVTRLVMSYQEFARELGWNDNYHSVMSNLTRLFFSRTAGEMVGEENEVGAEQIDSAKDRIQNIMYMVLFEGPTVVLGVLTATLLMFSVDYVAGLIMVLVVSLNVIWFLYFNSLIDEKMERVDKGFRRANRRMIEKWNMALSTKTNGVEDKVNRQVSREVLAPLIVDRKIWAYWFIPVDTLRKGLNSIFMVGTLAYGLTYGNWSGGDFAAIFFWFSMSTEQFGYLGHLMRHLTSQVVRVRAVREALTEEVAFRHDVGIEYQPKQKGCV